MGGGGVAPSPTSHCTPCLGTAVFIAITIVQLLVIVLYLVYRYVTFSLCYVMTLIDGWGRGGAQPHLPLHTLPGHRRLHRHHHSPTTGHRALSRLQVRYIQSLLCNDTY